MSDKKRILFVTPFFSPAWAYGGPPHVMHDLGAALVRNGLSVTCLTTNALESNVVIDYAHAQIDGIETHYFKNVSNRFAWAFKFFAPVGMRKYLEMHITKYNVVHIADFRNLCTFWAFQACRKTGIPYVISPFGSTQNTQDLQGIVKELFDISFAKKCLLQAHCVTVQTEHEYETVLRFGVQKKRICLVPLHVNMNKFANLPAPGLFREKHGIGQDEKIILFVGRINRHKATDMTIEVFRDLLKKDPACRLVFVGRNDGYENHLRRLAGRLNLTEKILFTGPIYYPQSMQAYVDADVFFLAPSCYEETSTASLEALACGCPIVVTRQADIPYVEKDGVGRVVLGKEECVNALYDTLKHPPAAAKCIASVRHHFSVDQIKTKFIQEIYP